MKDKITPSRKQRDPINKGEMGPVQLGMEPANELAHEYEPPEESIELHCAESRGKGVGIDR